MALATDPQPWDACGGSDRRAAQLCAWGTGMLSLLNCSTSFSCLTGAIKMIAACNINKKNKIY